MDAVLHDVLKAVEIYVAALDKAIATTEIQVHRAEEDEEVKAPFLRNRLNILRAWRRDIAPHQNLPSWKSYLNTSII